MTHQRALNGWGGESWTDPAQCICEHEPHDGECPETVHPLSGPMPCGCDEYCPNRS